ncbi:MAG: elongation factor Ts [Candidatus Omnitrophica bacterium]|nr:elongation factor Ts [Candidatus Omnitrophota bacterium]
MKEKIKELRERTGVAILDCRNALGETKGDIEEACEVLRKRGIAKARAKLGREARQGLIVSYVHPGNRVGVLIEVNCETDFVARTDDFQKLAKDLAMQVAASDPQYISPEDIPPEVVDKEKEIGKAGVGNKPEKILEKILQGKLEKFYEQVCLLRQPFIKDEDISVDDYIKTAIAKMGENIRVKRFTRYMLGGK